MGLVAFVILGFEILLKLVRNYMRFKAFQIEKAVRIIKVYCFLVDDFRSLSYQLSQSHFKDAVNSENAGRIEFLVCFYINIICSYDFYSFILNYISQSSGMKLYMVMEESMNDLNQFL